MAVGVGTNTAATAMEEYTREDLEIVAFNLTDGGMDLLNRIQDAWMMYLRTYH